ncbi:hypothetical protein JYT16_00675 [Gemmatimonas aurantiaca]|nr:hypothetical protein [Gemmatimonas aurantiaca]
MDYFADWTWQDYLVIAALILAVRFIWRMKIAPLFRKEATGCGKCGANPANTTTSSYKSQSIKLSDEQAAQMRSEIEAKD